MGKRINSNPGIRFASWLLLLSLAGAGCGDSREAENPGQVPQAGKAEPASRTGVLHDGYFYEEDGIIVSSGERFLYSDWEPVEFDYICTDPTCSHLTGSCSAHAVSGEGEMADDFSLLYQDRLIILHAYSELEVETAGAEDSEMSVTDFCDTYYTEVYEADPDGSNRRKKVTFPGSISNTVTTYTAVLADGKLYFGGPTKERSRWEYDSYGESITSENWFSDAIYCLDLNDYTIETFAAAEDEEGRGYMFQLYEYDGMIYAVKSSNQEDRAVWYRIDPASGGCEEILRFDSDYARFMGVIGETMYYMYNNSGETLYARDMAEGAGEREIMTVGKENMNVSILILDGQILFRADYAAEGEDRMSEYALLDKDGNLLDTIRYDDHIVFLDVLGDKIIYYRMGADWWEEYWADREHLNDLIEYGTKIGPLNGGELDMLAE